MLKAYAVALVLTTSTPAVNKELEGINAVDLKQQNQTQVVKSKGKLKDRR